MKRLSSLLFILATITTLAAQENTTPKITLKADTLSSKKESSVKPFRSLGLGLSSNLAFFSFNHFIMNEDFAQINIHTIKRNLNSKPLWDSDKYFTNMFGHPYQGSHYFSAARINGFSYYASLPFTAVGSLFWEYLMESEPPSTNDLWATSIGGMPMGEVFFRISDLIYDNRAVGADRFFREMFAGLITPMYAMNRWITGTHNHNPHSRGNLLPSIPYTGYFSIATRHLTHRKEDPTHGISLGVGIEYGDIFDDEIRTPFEWFEAEMQLDILYRQVMMSKTNINGALRTWELADKNNWQIMGGFFQPLTYYQSKMPVTQEGEPHPFYISEAAAIGTGLFAGNHKNRFRFRGSLFANAIMLGASTSDYIRIKERDYNYGSGFSIKAYSDFQFAHKFRLKLGFENYHLYTWQKYDESIDLNNMTQEEMLNINLQGDKSHANLYHLSMSGEYKLKENLALLIERNHYIRKTKYKHHPSVRFTSFDDYIKIRFGF